MSEILRVYDMDECDEAGVPLDWERCRTCKGNTATRFFRPGIAGLVPAGPTEVCARCAGHGSLKAAVLATLTTRCGAVDGDSGKCNLRFGHDGWHRETRDGKICAGWRAGRPNPVVDVPIRCEDCGHPMSEGAWEGTEWSGLPDVAPGSCEWAAIHLRQGHEPPARISGESTTSGLGFTFRVHYSPCDKGCRHGGLGRWFDVDFGDWHEVDDMPFRSGYFHVQEASWRPVDVRCFSWPIDLRPEKLAVLCLRCWAKR